MAATDKWIPYNKLSKKKKRQLNKVKRATWGPLNPVTRKPPDPGVYDRRAFKRASKKAIDESEDI